ncbi:unnamed protein product [Gongylonema pulchrum]|uniref:Long-chain-fatty-acid--CoA ligase n=1 Tax=Gongylonema pulchrum TaxID=637853 RepID=A0A183DI12_9BILA|nr:unnamed protein product [Gongylonema pulchrum]
MRVYVVDDVTSAENGIVPLAVKISRTSPDEPIVEEKPTFRSVLCYIFTSGTTGNPKPAVIKHYSVCSLQNMYKLVAVGFSGLWPLELITFLRYYWMAMGVAKSFGIYTSDRMYVMMPIYHSAGGILGIGQVVLQGSTAVVRKKFSASNFWKDCSKHDCTVSQYIGEMCRFVVFAFSKNEIWNSVRRGGTLWDRVL